MIHPISLTPTLPRHPAIGTVRTVYKKSNRSTKVLLILFGLFAALVCSCVASLAAYVLLAPTIDVAVLGVDSRGSTMNARTDSIMLLGVDPGNLRVSLLSIPRDVFIDVPGYGLQRANTINVLGENAVPGSGPQLFNAAIQQSFGVQPDRYVRLNFGTFVDLVDAVGGVTIEVEHPIIDYAYPTGDGGTMQVSFEAGEQRMNGEQALIYARTRHADDDYRRASRQQQVVEALSNKLMNPLRWPTAIIALNRNMDTNLSLLDMAVIAPALVLNAGDFDRLVIDREYLVGAGDGIVAPNYDLLRPWIDERFN